MAAHILVQGTVRPRRAKIHHKNGMLGDMTRDETFADAL